MDGFEKFDLQANRKKVASAREDASFREMRKNKKTTKRKILFTVLGVLVVIVLFVILGVVLPGMSVAKNAKLTMADAQQVEYWAKHENVNLASSNLDQTKADLLKTQASLHHMAYLKFIPPFSMYYNDADHLINAGFAGLQGGRVLIDSVSPYADVLGLKGQGTFTGGTAEQRIQTAVTTLSKITPNIDKISQSLVVVKQELDQVDPNHYPSLLGGDKVKKYLSEARTVADGADTFVKEATPLIKVLPVQLGEPDQKKYLVLFQNNAELRATGGFISAYTVLNFEHGVMHPEKADDIYTLDGTIPTAYKPIAPRPILDYLANVPQLNLRDTNLSPDFETSINTFNSLYTKAGSYEKVDGIIAIDTQPMVDAIDILGGEIQVDGVTMTSHTNPICHCADVIYQLEQNVDTPVNYVKTNRKGIIGDLMVAIIHKAFSSSPKLYWGPLFQTLLTDTAQKHILFDVYNQDAQSGIEALNAAGKIVPFEGDYLHINDVNFGGAKSNLFVTEAVSQNYQINSDGSIQKTITINYKNPYPPSNCSLKDQSLCLNATLRDWLRIYVPQGSQLVNSQGSEVKLTTYDELGKTVFDGFLTVRPLGIANFTITYKLPFKVAGNSLPVLIQKQPGTNSNQYTISVNGNQVDQFPLLQDKTLKLTP